MLHKSVVSLLHAGGTPGGAVRAWQMPAMVVTFGLAHVCQAQTGACCNMNGACTLGTAAQCVGGVWHGAGSSCANLACPQPIGACCTGPGGCSLIGRAACQLAGSIYIGDGVMCGAAGACPIGACCLTDGSCTAGLSQQDCLSWGGTFQGVASTCVEVMCPQPVGACCTATSCATIPSSFCQVLGGDWRGPGTACTAGGMCPARGVCCRGATCSTSIAQADCTGPSAGIGARFVIQGSSACNDAGNAVSPCCHADFNKSGTVSAQDIFDYLGAWFAGSPFARLGGDGLGMPSVPDIFAFLGAWFAGC